MECNLYEHIKGRKSYLKPEKIKLYMYQLFKALDHMHSNGIFHRDIKPFFYLFIYFLITLPIVKIYYFQGIILN